MPTMYELSKELAVINDELITAEGEITPDLEDRLDGVKLALHEKSLGIRKWLAIIDGNSGALDAEINRLRKMKQTNDNLHDRLKEYIKHNMELADLRKIETPLGTFTIAANPPSLQVDEAQIPDEHKTLIPERWELTAEDKKRIKAALKIGVEIAGARLITDRTSLRIK